jgi:ABC-type cobalamin/Fe3+-siderophores transport system ATPase subunit
MNEFAPVVALHDVSAGYFGHVALNRVSLTIQEDDLVVVAGPNGAGKSTLLGVINGLIPVSGGTANVLGVELPAGVRRVCRDIGYVPQTVGGELRIPMTVRDVISMGRYARIPFLKRFTPNDRNIVERSAWMCGLSHLMERSAGGLSGGEAKKVAIARALAQEARILLLDEPGAHLDPQAAEAIISLIESVHVNNGLTTVMVSHHVDLLPERTNRLLLLRDGGIMFDGSVEEARIRCYAGL